MKDLFYNNTNYLTAVIYGKNEIQNINLFCKNGLLTLIVLEQLYQRIGIVGKRVKKNYFEIVIEVKRQSSLIDRLFSSPLAGIDLECFLFDIEIERLSRIASSLNCTQSIVKMPVEVPSFDDNSSLLSLLEWIGILKGELGQELTDFSKSSFITLFDFGSLKLEEKKMTCIKLNSAFSLIQLKSLFEVLLDEQSEFIVVIPNSLEQKCLCLCKFVHSNDLIEYFMIN